MLVLVRCASSRPSFPARTSPGDAEEAALVDRPWYTRFNWPLAIAPVLTTILGIVFIRSATLHDRSAHNEWRSQLVYALVGIVLMIGVAFIDYRVWRRWALPMYVVTLGLLAFITFKGHEALGAARWIKIGSFTFQPSEPAKVVLAIAIAALLCRGSYRKIQEIWLPLLAVGVPAVLILKQPDLGTTLVIGGILTAQLYFGLPNLIDFGLYVGGVLTAAAYVLTSEHMLKPFQKARLTVFLDPKVDPQGVGYNLNQSKIAVGSGEWFGKGLYHGTQTQLAFVPENSRDFIFTAVGEEAGLIGALVLIALYAVTIGFAMRAVFAAKDRFGVLLAVGLVAMLAFHIVVNIGMTIGIMPITGIPLPFMSYGGSALMTDYIAVGILLNIVLQKDKLVFGDAARRV
jgi:rod shape determining protein RodA